MDLAREGEARRAESIGKHPAARSRAEVPSPLRDIQQDTEVREYGRLGCT